MTFLDVLQQTDLSALRRSLDAIGPREVQAALASPAARLEDFLALISPAAADFLEPMARRAQAVTVQRFGRCIQMYAPLYVSNWCINGCLYCGFHGESGQTRTALSDEQVLAEGRYLHDVGFRHLLLVSGEAPRKYPLERLGRAIELLSPLFSSVSIEVQALTEPQYAQVARAGAEGVTMFQETYDRALYTRVHPRGPKSDYANRLEAPERAARAGFRRLSLGALLGLSDFRVEAIALALHADHLLRTHWRTQVSINVPRLRNAPAELGVPAPVSDRDLVQMLLALRIHLPDVGLVMSTREPPALRDRLIPLGITQMSAGSKTDPGGYRQQVHATEQFAVEDGRSVAEVAAAIRRAGYDPVWKDWDAQMRGGSACESR